MQDKRFSVEYIHTLSNISKIKQYSLTLLNEAITKPRLDNEIATANKLNTKNYSTRPYHPSTQT